MHTTLRHAAWLALLLCGGGAVAPAGAQPVSARDTALDATAALLIDLIRVNTSNPPGNEAALVHMLAPRFRALGFEVDVIATPDPVKAHLVARLRGSGKKRPVLLAAHTDVVGVEREKWTVNPFAGVVTDGFVYGRGAIDFKGGLAVFARAVMLLAERKVPLDRDVIFVAEANEEGALPYNASWLAENHWPKVDAEFALNEGGWIIQRAPGGPVRYVSISTADKVAFNVVLTARGTSTHSSMPTSDNALYSLGRALAKLSEYKLPVTLTPGTRKFFTALANTSTGDEQRALRELVSGDSARANAAGGIVGRNPLFDAIMRTTLAPVLMSAGFRGNVIPGSAEATINVRAVPGTDPEAVARDIRRVIADSTVDVRLPARRGGAIQESSDTTALFRALVSAARVQFPGAEVTPSLFQAGTDAVAWRSRGVPVYGIYPYPIPSDDLRGMHGNDERVSVESLRHGTEMIYRTLVEVAGARPGPSHR